MNNELYCGLTEYLDTLQIPADTSSEIAMEIRKTINHYFLRNGILHRRRNGQPPLLVIPERRKREALEEAHDNPLSGHNGVNNTYHRLSQKYYWKTMHEDIRQHVQTCDTCQKRRYNKQTEQL